MCDFFSFVSKGDGKFKFFSAKERKKEMVNGREINNYNDSHSTIASVKFNDPCADDYCNKFEYIPRTKELIVDQINAKKDDTKAAAAFIKRLIRSGEFRRICLVELENGKYEDVICKSIRKIPEKIQLDLVKNGYYYSISAPTKKVTALAKKLKLIK